MKDTPLLLDVLFLDSAGVIVYVQTKEPEPGVGNGLLWRYTLSQAGAVRPGDERGALSYGFTVGTQVPLKTD